MSHHYVVNETPYRIGVLQDWAIGAQVSRDFIDAIRLAVEEAVANRVTDRAIDLVVREVKGPPLGRPDQVVSAWREVAGAEQSLAIIGPHRSESALLLRDEINASGIPVLSMAATQKFYGDCCFSLSNGCFADVGPLLVDHLLRRGIDRVGVFRDSSVGGFETWQAFERFALENGLDVVSEKLLRANSDDAACARAAEHMRNAGAKAVVYLGDVDALTAVAAGVTGAMRDGWLPYRATGLAFAATAAEMQPFGIAPAALDGWAGLDQYHEQNRVAADVFNRFEKRFGRKPSPTYAALGFDMGITIAHALSQARPHSREGLRRALERFRRFPAAAGGPGNLIGFLPWDHRGYKGDYLVFRAIEGGRNRGLSDLTLLTE